MFGFVGEHSSALDAESSSAATPLPRDGDFLLKLLKQVGGGGGGSCTSNAKKKSVISGSNNYNNNSNARMHGESKQAIACTDWYSDPAIAALVGPPSIFQPPPNPQASEQNRTCDGDHRTWMPSQLPQESFERGYLRPLLDPYLLSSMPDANHFRPSLGTSSGVLRHQYMPDNQPFGQFGHLPHPTSSSSSLLPPYPSSSPPLPPYSSSSSSSSPFPPHPSSSSSHFPPYPSSSSSSPFPPYPSSSSSSSSSPFPPHPSSSSSSHPSSSPFPPHPSSSSPLIDHHHRPIPSYRNDYSQTWPFHPPHRQVELDHCLESSIHRVDNRWVPSGEGGNPDLCFPSLLPHSIEAISTSRRRPTPPLPPTSRDQYPIGLPNLGYYPGENSRREPPPLMGRQGHERNSKDGEFYSGTGHGRDKSPSSSTALGQNGSALKRVNNYTSVEDVDRHEEEDGDLLNEVSNSLGDLDIAKASANLSLKQKEDLQNRKPVHQTWRLKQNHVKILPLVDYQSAEASIPLEDRERGMSRYNKNSKPVSGSIPEQSQQEMYGNNTTQRSGQGREKEEGFFTENSDQFDDNEQDIKRSIPHSKKLGNADLQQRATRPSLGRLLRKEEGSPRRVDSEKLTRQLLTLIESLIPHEDEKKRRHGLLSCLEDIIRWDWPEARLLLFGSCANAFGVSNSDIDICLAIDDESSSKADIVAKLAKVLEANRMQNVQALTHARVPIVKFTDPETGISCDICINNILAVVNTKLLHDYAQIDDRLQQLAFAVKHWAKCRRVNETYRGTLSSYAYVLMCIHFLQQRKPPILPCLQEMEPTYNVRIGDCECAYYDQVNRLKFFGSKNKESLGELLASFFDYWGFRHDYSRTVISVRTGRFLSKMEKDWTRRIGNDRHLICIEDPFETCHDLGRVVDKHSIKILRDEFQRAASIIRSDPNPCGTLFLDPYDANKTD